MPDGFQIASLAAQVASAAIASGALVVAVRVASRQSEQAAREQVSRVTVELQPVNGARPGVWVVNRSKLPVTVRAHGVDGEILLVRSVTNLERSDSFDSNQVYQKYARLGPTAVAEFEIEPVGDPPNVNVDVRDASGITWQITPARKITRLRKATTWDRI